MNRPQPTVIVDIGNNHEGNFQVALELIERAKECGADLAKFQAGRAEGCARTPQDIPRYRKYEFTKEEYERLIKHGEKVGIPVFFSVWSEEFADFRKLPYFKIPARQCNRDYIQRYSTETTFISVPHTLDDVRGLGIRKGVVLHCVSHYPAQAGFFWRFHELRRELGVSIPLGFSDHFIGIEYAVTAVHSYQAVAIEKHFTLRHDFGPLRDHQLSATPEELRELVERVKS